MYLSHETISQTYETRYAHALMVYAEHDSIFAAEFRTLIRSYAFSDTYTLSSTEIQAPVWLMPTDSTTATRRAYWLLSELSRGALPASSDMRGLLSAWARDEYEPKNIVLGIVGVAIIGPTLGLIKRKERDRMHVVITDTYTQDSKKVAEAVQHASLNLLAHELQKVHGEAYRLEPELADWFFGEKETVMYTASKNALQKIADELCEEHIPHAMYKKDSTLLSIALTPSVNSQILTTKSSVTKMS